MVATTDLLLAYFCAWCVAACSADISTLYYAMIGCWDPCKPGLMHLDPQSCVMNTLFAVAGRWYDGNNGGGW